MRLGLIADIHANLIALEALLSDLERTEVDQIICLGDVAASGPHPRETVARLRALGYPTVMGNADEELFNFPEMPRIMCPCTWRLTVGAPRGSQPKT